MNLSQLPHTCNPGIGETEAGGCESEPGVHVRVHGQSELQSKGTGVLFPVPTSGNSEPPVTLAPGGLTPPLASAHTPHTDHRHIHI